MRGINSEALLALAPELVSELRAARDLIVEAIDQHIYDAGRGQAPDEDCDYTAQVRAIDSLLQRIET
jgi:hypothetical protein